MQTNQTFSPELVANIKDLASWYEPYAIRKELWDIYLLAMDGCANQNKLVPVTQVQEYGFTIVRISELLTMMIDEIREPEYWRDKIKAMNGPLAAAAIV